MLPITELLYGLGPACVLTAIVYMCFMHAFWVLEGGDLLQEMFHRTFTTLFTGALPSTTQNCTVGLMLLTYIAILFFSVFILNIFIGVISDQYLQAKDRVESRYQQRLCKKCCDYLLRTCLMPTIPMLHLAVVPVVVCLGLALVSMQALGLMQGSPVVCSTWLEPLCLLIMAFMLYQNPQAPKHNQDDLTKYY